ncbi:hypothetical protein NKG94_12815 [Micromonospora sp. M12]
MSSIAIFGAAGRAGRAITAEARPWPSGHRRCPGSAHGRRHHGGRRLGGPGDVTDPRSTAAIAPGHDAVVSAVTPASSPRPSPPSAASTTSSSSPPPTRSCTA